MSFPIYVISLARSIERRHKIEAAFETLNLEFSYIDAIDARAVSADTILKQTDPVRTKKRLYREMTLGEYACALSHQKAYRAFLETDQPFALFFEDDAIIDTRLKTYLQSEQGGQQDIVLFYHSKARAYGAPKSIGQGMHLRQLARSAVGAVAYGINRKTAQYLMDDNTPVSYVADWPIDFGQISAWGCVPRIVDHPEVTKDQSAIGLDRPKPKLPISRIFSMDYVARKYRKLISRQIS